MSNHKAKALAALGGILFALTGVAFWFFVMRDGDEPQWLFVCVFVLLGYFTGRLVNDLYDIFRGGG